MAIRGRLAKNTDESETFPEVELGLGVTAQLVLVTKDIATKWMSKPGPEQRRILPEHLDAIKRELAEERWILNGSPIVFDHEERVLTGRHRLTAAIETEIPMMILVIRGIDPEAYPTLNAGAKGKACSILGAAGYKNSSHLSSAARMLKRYEMNALQGMEAPRSVELFGTAALDMVAQHPGLEDSFSKIGQAFKLCGFRGALTFCHYILADIHSATADDFFEKFGTGEDMHRGHPILAMRNYVIQTKTKGKLTADDLPIILFKGWNLHRTSKKPVFNFRIEPNEQLQEPE